MFEWRYIFVVPSRKDPKVTNVIQHIPMHLWYCSSISTNVMRPCTIILGVAVLILITCHFKGTLDWLHKFIFQNICHWNHQDNINKIKNPIYNPISDPFHVQYEGGTSTFKDPMIPQWGSTSSQVGSICLHDPILYSEVNNPYKISAIRMADLMLGCHLDVS